eukprot:11305747-Heterocapsa_arctica.AAC.1
MADSRFRFEPPFLGIIPKTNRLPLRTCQNRQTAKKPPPPCLPASLPPSCLHASSPCLCEAHGN